MRMPEYGDPKTQQGKLYHDNRRWAISPAPRVGYWLSCLTERDAYAAQKLAALVA